MVPILLTILLQTDSLSGSDTLNFADSGHRNKYFTGNDTLTFSGRGFRSHDLRGSDTLRIHETSSTTSGLQGTDSLVYKETVRVHQILNRQGNDTIEFSDLVITPQNPRGNTADFLTSRGSFNVTSDLSLVTTEYISFTEQTTATFP